MEIWRRKALFSCLKVYDLAVFCAVFLLSASVESASIRDMSFENFLEMRLKVGNALGLMGLLIACHALFSAIGLYRSRRFENVATDIRDFLKGSVAATLLLWVAGSIFHITMITPLFLTVFLPTLAAVLILSRLLLRFLLIRLRVRGRNLRYVLIVGTNERSIKIAQRIVSKPELGLIVSGFVDDEWAGVGGIESRGFKRVADLNSLPEYLRSHVVDEIIVTLPYNSMYARAAEVAELCRKQGIIVRHPASAFSNKLAGTSRDYLDNVPVITHFRGPITGWRFALKRTLDILLSAVSLALLAPFLLIVALVIRADSPGPAFFVQERVGLNKRRFQLWKFRTMVADAEARQKELECQNETCGPTFKIKNDPRVTRVGRILRKTSIDELPQLWNVLKGDMSLVGPRPLPVRDYEGFGEDRQRRRFSVRPGITCIWQINGRSNTTFEKWMRQDMEYIDNWSLLLDAKILLLTIPAVLRGSGAV